MKAKHVFESSSMYQDFISNDTLMNKILQKIIDAGYIIHGSSVTFDTFDPKFIKGSNSAVYGYGIYFSDEIYKFSEYNTDPKNFKFVDKNNFKLLDLKLTPANIRFESIHEKIESFNADKVKLDGILDNVRSNKDYIEIMNQIDNLETIMHTIKSRLHNKYFELIDNEIRRNENIPFVDILKSVRSKFIDDAVSKEFSDYAFSIIGVDGFKYENQYVIFNYDKLNNVLIKDNEKFINNIK